MPVSFLEALGQARRAHESDVATAAEAILFLHSDEAARMVASWKRVRLARSMDTVHLPDDLTDEERWSSLWGCVGYDVEEWARVADVPLGEARRLAYVLQVNRVVYPDGTINQWAKKKLGERIAASAKAKGKR